MSAPIVVNKDDYILLKVDTNIIKARVWSAAWYEGKGYALDYFILGNVTDYGSWRQWTDGGTLLVCGTEREVDKVLEQMLAN